VLFFMSLSNAQDTPFSGKAWESQTSDYKRAALTAIITNDTTSGTYPGVVEEAELFIEDMNTSFDTVADDMPFQLLASQRRPKLIHSVGVVASAVWTPVPNSLGYTGIFKSGCKDMYVRLSCAKAPAAGTGGYTPGLSLKCLRSGVKAADMFAMYSLQGQDSWNFFKNDLTNHVPDLSTSANFVLKEIRKTFEKASAWPVMIGLSDLAHYDESGTNFTSPVFPFRLVFHPTTALHNQFPDAPSSQPFQQVLADGLQTPADMFYVYAVLNPNDTPDKFVQVATISTVAPATSSYFGDTFMFFQHVRMEADLAFRPDWIDPANQIMANQQAINNYVYPNLPFN